MDNYNSSEMTEFTANGKKPASDLGSVGENDVSGLVYSNDLKVRDDIQPRVFLQRWLILAIFCCYSMTNAAQWIQYSVISNIIVDYYGESTIAVNWLSMIYMLAYIPLIFPATWLLDKKGKTLTFTYRFLCKCVQDK